MEVDEKKLREYVKLYQIARLQLPSLIPELTEFEIRQQVSARDWLIFPLFSEADRKEGVNRPDPHIDITLREPEKVRIGIRCNTIKSVDKLKNILNGYHAAEKDKLLLLMNSLDDRFITSIINKQKEYNFAQMPKHETIFQEKSNSINGIKIMEMFELIDKIRQRGIEKRKEQGVSFLPEAPVIDLTYVSVPLEEEAYRLAMIEIGKIYELCIRIKTISEIETIQKESNKRKKVIFQGYICTKCKATFPLDQKPMFCPICGTYISQR